MIELKHGTVYSMTRASQDVYDHSIPPEQEAVGPRISITLRHLLPPGTRHPQHKPADKRVKPTQVLVLSDSRNTSFDCSTFKQPIYCFKEKLYCLSDIGEHAELIDKADVVLISCGINDLAVRNRNPREVFESFRNSFYSIKKRSPNKRIIFEAIAPVSMTADRYNVINPAINYLNSNLFELALREPGFKLFDNSRFGLAHLTRDGVHLTQLGKDIVSRNWVHCVLIILGKRPGPLPLRREYQNRYLEFMGYGSHSPG